MKCKFDFIVLFFLFKGNRPFFYVRFALTNQGGINLKKVTTTLLASSLVLSGILPSTIHDVKPFVKVNEEGYITFKENIPQKIRDQYALDELQLHFDTLNQSVKNGEIRINKDLSIDETMIARAAVYSKWTYHWWGYDRKFNNSQTKSYINYCQTIAGGAGIVTGAGAYFPPVALIGGMQTGYWALFATRLDANNKGHGVYVSVTWAAVFDIEPL